MGKRGAELRGTWSHLFDEYRQHYPELADHLYQMRYRQLPEDWDRDVPTFEPDSKGVGVASRESSGKVLNASAKNIPWLIGGSADLAPSTKTRLNFEGSGDFQAENYAGQNFHFGVREHAMSAILNGMSLSKIRPFGSGFLIFSDYARPAIRLSALMEIPVLYIWTHDSISQGEDGPTHQTVEHLLSLRAMPGLIVMRPADANEVVEAWRVIMELQHEPVVMVLSRQALPTFDRTRYGSASGVACGAYVMADAVDGKPNVPAPCNRSEVALCVTAYEQLKAEGLKARVVSMPSWELFERQSQEYRESVIPPDVAARVAVEEASTLGWAQYVGLQGTVIGMHTFGESAPLQAVQRYFHFFTPEHVVAAAKEQIARA
jgi:transketolase